MRSSIKTNFKTPVLTFFEKLENDFEGIRALVGDEGLKASLA